ncbi:MAG: glycine zipper domain-containing protein [Phycisphaerales bacterium]
MKTNTRRCLRIVTLTSLVLAATGLAGCNNAQEGVFSGAALGALAGMGLGSLSGDMGKGAAAGAIIGGIGGAVLGDQNRRSGGGGGYSGGY